MGHGQQQETPLSAFCLWEKQSPQQIFLRQPVSGSWKSWTFQQAGDEIRRIAAALLALKLPPASNIAILSKNCAHWIMADLAIMMSGYVSVPIYPTLSATGIQELLNTVKHGSSFWESWMIMKHSGAQSTRGCTK